MTRPGQFGAAIGVSGGCLVSDRVKETSALNC